MSVAIVYASRYGTTAHVARRITENVSVPATLHDLANDREPNLGDARIVVVGAPIYGGRLPGHARRYLEFAERNLLQREVALFISCLFQGEKAQQQLVDAFPDSLAAHAFGRYAVGGAVAFEKLSFFHKLIMRKVGGLNTSIERINGAEIDRLIADVNARLA